MQHFFPHWLRWYSFTRASLFIVGEITLDIWQVLTCVCDNTIHRLTIIQNNCNAFVGVLLISSMAWHNMTWHNMKCHNMTWHNRSSKQISPLCALKENHYCDNGSALHDFSKWATRPTYVCKKNTSSVNHTVYLCPGWSLYWHILWIL